MNHPNFCKGDFILKTNIRNRGVTRSLLPTIVGIVCYALLGLLISQLILSGTLPEEFAQLAMYAALAVASLFAGALCRGGKHGLFTGALLAGGYLIAKLILESGDIFSVHTLIGVACTLFGAWLGSCIFHKKQKPYTNRNRKNRRRNYK